MCTSPFTYRYFNERTYAFRAKDSAHHKSNNDEQASAANKSSRKRAQHPLPKTVAMTNRPAPLKNLRVNELGTPSSWTAIFPPRMNSYGGIWLKVRMTLPCAVAINGVLLYLDR
ncbi:hypothetical protein BOTBODRAFT_33604 [Botryobasidium botryosum FD-172 SS1]|uniref:Uncharacterized protein n=1 Tax=Botryobasidium botryosum (strain FD-172 SS1) TaxID=930990 RepID=A0A067MN26_BOTB1|nr:hypothetical protein BOTBODRAFT_33604 [Botryobasidium botryosum FD-172 SS1]